MAGTLERTTGGLDSYERFRQLLLEWDFKPPCSCPICKLQYRYECSQDLPNFAYWDELNSDEAKDIATSFSLSIRQDWLYLRAAILKHDAHILKRWCRNRKSRQKILDDASTETYRFRFPVLDLASKLNGKTLGEQRKHHNTFLLPYLNIEDLVSDPYRFICLLHYRCSYPPVSWVPFDNSLIQMVWKQGALTEKSADGCILMGPDTYSIWTDFSPDAVHRGEAYGTPRGLLILEAQSLLMSRLRSITNVILGPMSIAWTKSELSVYKDPETFSDPGPCKVWMEFVHTRGKVDQTSKDFGSIFTDLPYSAPPRLDVDLLIDVAEARSAEAHDELWLLQTDVAYFYDRVRYHNVRWFDKVPTADGLRRFTAKEKLGNVCFIVTIKALIQARDWQWILEECQAVKAELVKSKAGVQCGKPLPASYEKALGSLQRMLEIARSDHQSNLRRLMLKLPQFREVFKIVSCGEVPLFGSFHFFDAKDYSTLYEKGRIGWCLYHLVRSEENPDTFDPSFIFPFLEDFLSTTSIGEAKRMSQDINACVSDLVAVIQMLKVIGFHRPYFRRPSIDALQDSCPAWQVHARFMRSPTVVRAKLMDLSSAISPLTKFQLPKGRKDEKWIKGRDSAYEALSRVWEKARSGYQMMLESKGVPQDIISHHLTWMQQCDSPEIMAQRAAEKQDILDRLRASRQAMVARNAVENTRDYHSYPLVTTQKKQDRPVEAQSSKVKTRPQNSLQPKEIGQAMEEVQESTSETQILYTTKVGSVTDKVISLLFAASSDKDFPEGKTLKWVDFASAMGTLGFGVEHGGGSAFTFRGKVKIASAPEEMQKRSFVVHRPHPDPELGQSMLRGLGKRLNRRFGWERGNFATIDGEINTQNDSVLDT